MGRRPRRRWLGYAMAVAVCMGAAGIQDVLHPHLEGLYPLAVFPAAVIVAAWLGGLGPGILTTVGAAFAAAYVFFDPTQALWVSDTADLVALALFVLAGVLISIAVHRLDQRAQSESEARADTERLLRHTAHLQDLTSALSRAQTPGTVIRECLTELLHALGADAGAAALLVADGSALEVVHTVGYPVGDAPLPTRIPLGSRTLIAAAVGRRELLVQESTVGRRTDFPTLDAEDPLAGHAAAMALPLAAGSHLRGALVLAFSRPRGLERGEYELLQNAARHTGQALERARLYEVAERARAEAEASSARADTELRERQRVEVALRESETRYRSLAARTSRLYSLSAGLSEAATIDAVARAIVQQGRNVVGAPAAAVAALTDAGCGFEILCGEEYPPDVLAHWRRFAAEPGLCWTAAVDTGQGVFIRSFDEWRQAFPASAPLAADGGFASAAVLPLKVEGATLGVLAFHFTAPVNFEDDYVALLGSVAQHCAQALDRARLYEAAQRARAEAELANRSKDDFLSTVSHELRTPLNAILGWATMLRNGSLDADRRPRALDAIFNNATRQADLIEELLDVSRIVAGRATFDAREIDISDNIRGAVEAVMPLAAAKGIELVYEPLRGVHVMVDPRRLEQVFLNLLTNAVKFTPAEGRVTVRTHVAGGSVHVRVADTGVGIDAAFLPHVFDRFRQADGTTARNASGLGLGLFIARYLTEAQKGTIHADSAGPGLGATFTVSLPLAVNVPDSARPADTPAVHAAARPDLAGVRVLIVDDEQDALEMMTSALEACGAVVLPVSSAREALRTLARRDVDVLLTDIAMPGVDGYQLIQAIRSMPSSRIASLPAAAVTASARDDERRRALEAGFQVHVTKPAHPDTIANTVARLVHDHTGSAV